MPSDQMATVARDFAFSIARGGVAPGMQLWIVALTAMMVMAFAPAATAGGKKQPKLSVTFHMETEATDNPKMIFPQMTNNQRRFFRRVPEIGTRDIVSYNPFPSEFGDGDFGAVFQLKGNVAGRLAAITNANQGRWMISQVNGRVVDGVMIDRQISDGKLVIWKGLTLADVALLDEELGRTGDLGKKKK